MKRIVLVFASIASFAISCTVNPDIFPDPSSVDAGPDALSSSSSSSSSSASSSSNGSPLPGDGSGTRLKRYVYTSGDGLFVGREFVFFDSAMGLDCSPWLTPAGLRCIPLSSAIAVGPTFVDASCTAPAANVQSNCPAPLYAYNATGASCVTKNVYSFFYITLAEPQKLYNMSGGCIETTVGPNVTVYAVGPEVDYTQFAAMTLEHE